MAGFYFAVQIAEYIPCQTNDNIINNFFIIQCNRIILNKRLLFMAKAKIFCKDNKKTLAFIFFLFYI